MNGSEEALVQCLKDSGCSKTEITDFLECRKKQKEQEELSVLRKHRTSLLDKLHKSQKQIDCLDYLIYQMERNGKTIK